jgi:antirestriction protein ArdC
MEELVAELGSALLSADLDLTLEVRDDHAAYIAHWLKTLQDDKRFIFTAAAHAQRAADHLHGYQSRTDGTGTPAEAGPVAA